MRDIQYAAAFRLYHRRLWDTGSSAFADDDSWSNSDTNAPLRSRGAFRPSH